VRLLEAQNAALRSATADAAAAAATPAAVSSGVSRAAAAPPLPPARQGQPRRAGRRLQAGGSGWTDTERKLRKRVEALTARLAEAAKDAEAARAGEAAASTALTRLKGERDALDKRLAAVHRKQAALDAATASALEHLAPVAQARRGVAEGGRGKLCSTLGGKAHRGPDSPAHPPPTLEPQLRERIFELEGALAAVQRARGRGAAC